MGQCVPTFQETDLIVVISHSELLVQAIPCFLQG
jgi:hypothetical protein